MREAPMEEGTTGSWADQTSGGSHDDGVPVPDVLQHLINHGV